MPEWPYSKDERWVFEPAELGTPGAARVAVNLRSNISVGESSVNPLGFGRGLVLQRGNSAPSILFEDCALADFNAEEVVALLANSSDDPFRVDRSDDDDPALTWMADNVLAQVVDVERGPRQLLVQMENILSGAASSSLDGCCGEFLSSQAGRFERRISTIFTPTAQSCGPDKFVAPRSLTLHPDGYDANRPGESVSDISGRNGGNTSTMSSASLAPENQLSYQLGSELPGASPSDDTVLWNYPTTPEMLDGTSLLLPGTGVMANTEPHGWCGSISTSAAARPSVRDALEPAPPTPRDLVRHSSLPANLRTANRGRATNPRSVAERVRRGKISERLQKLQNLVPNMKPPSTTAEMLDEVVEYVKQLKLQVQELSDTVEQLQETLIDHCPTNYPSSLS